MQKPGHQRHDEKDACLQLPQEGRALPWVCRLFGILCIRMAMSADWRVREILAQGQIHKYGRCHRTSVCLCVSMWTENLGGHGFCPEI